MYQTTDQFSITNIQTSNQTSFFVCLLCFFRGGAVRLISDLNIGSVHSDFKEAV